MAAQGALSALQGAPNFRDLGGLPAAGGRSVRHGLVFRSGHLGELHAQDVAQLRASLGEDVCVVDLRGSSEREKFACVLPGASVHSLPIEPTVAQKLTALAASGELLTPAATRRFMREAYEGFVRNAQPQMRAFFGHVIGREGKPLVIHCAAGKDRTGFMVAMLLSALGVSRQVVIEDYLVTNQRVSPKESARFPPEIMEVLGTVREEFLEAAFDCVEREFGGVDNYLARAGMDVQSRTHLQDQVLSSRA